MRRILLFLILSLLLSACGSDDDIEIRYSGQINGEFEATGGFKCLLIDGNKVPFLSFLSSEEDDLSWVLIYLMPKIAPGNYQFTSESIEGDDIVFVQHFDTNRFPGLVLGDLASGELTLTQLPDRERGRVEGEFDVVYPNVTVEGTFKFRADPDEGPFDCVN